MGPTSETADVRRAVRTALADVEVGDLVLAACSGGADSLALALAVAVEAPKRGVRAGAVTVDHGLQPGSSERAAQTGATLRDLALDPVLVRAVDVGARGGPEGAARNSRYAALDRAADETGAVAVLLAHTRDDQAETVLLGLARGSGARSLSGMAVRSGRYLRPFLDVSRATLRAACGDAGLEPWEDPHNADPAFARARVRHRVLPVLDAELGPGVAAALARTARLLRADADALDAWAYAAAEAATNGPGELDVAALADVPAAVRARVLHTAARTAGSPPTDLSAGHVAELDRLVTDWHGQGPIDLPGHVTARRDGPTIRLRRLP